MSMRDFIGIVEILTVEEQDLLEKSEVVEQDAPSTNSRITWISPMGERVLLENANECDGHIQVYADSQEFAAQWDENISPGAAARLAEIINESGDYEVYHLNSMTFVLKRQALAAANSLAKHP